MNELTSIIIASAIEVHKCLGPGLLESTYEQCLFRELQLRGIPCEQQRELPLEYKGLSLVGAYRIDLVVAGTVIVEVKSVSELAKIHEAQVLTYLKLTGLPVGLLLNFNVPVMKDGIRRLKNGHVEQSST
ncbi:GxxExxY protein [Caulifigura coniformis]|uniref:GxxExxY protein n=1 Tax=Caulifigura coniformis TaxID=2527983 RepID=UPI001E3C8324|nr:GxxExxY protein [Caulifigura coniformis]